MISFYLVLGLFLVILEFKKRERWNRSATTILFLSICITGVACFLNQAVKKDLVIYLMLSINALAVLPVLKMNKFGVFGTGFMLLFAFVIEKEFALSANLIRMDFSYVPSNAFRYAMSLLVIFICVLVINEKGER